MMTKRQAFYKSHKWEKFINALRLERMQLDGTIICEHCGKSIVSKYDCIGHHVTELTDENVDDVMIALNPENVQLIHFRCHNEIHKRFGFRREKKVFIVWGAPCSGKSTWVNSVADPDDLILDIDRLWGAIRAEACGSYGKPPELKANVFALRDCLLDDIRTRRGRWTSAYIIGGYPLEGERERLADLVGADRMIFIDADQQVCEARATEKSPEWIMYVQEWFSQYHPPVG